MDPTCACLAQANRQSHFSSVPFAAIFGNSNTPKGIWYFYFRLLSEHCCSPKGSMFGPSDGRDTILGNESYIPLGTNVDSGNHV